MATLTEEIRETVLSLPERERIALAGEMLKSVPGELAGSADQVQEAWDSEIAERIKEIDSGEVTGVPAEEVFGKLNKEFGWRR